MTETDGLIAAVISWIEADPDPTTRHELGELLAQGQLRELARRFNEPMAFGTAGLRGPVQGGPAGMNRITVRQATVGVAALVLASGPEAAARGVVIGRDARHGSDIFSEDAAAVLCGAGIRVHLLPRPLPTPFVPFLVRALGAEAGIMITASHNPPQDNGYKVYLRDGAQVIEPFDHIIEASRATPSESDLADTTSSLLRTLEEADVHRYRQHQVERFALDHESPLRIVYTPMHGVGGETMVQLFSRCGFGEVTVVAEQFTPDPDFPTVAFPNPEEPGALDLAIATARVVGADLIVANDPDADRLAIGLVDAATGTVRVLRGDEIGWVLATALIESGVGDDAVMATTIVSSTMLRLIAADSGVRFIETLTGFKWIARAGKRSGHRLAFGYEEALGYAVDDAVADKDGISAALAFCNYAEHLRRQGRTIAMVLDELASKFGPHVVDQLSLRFDGPDALARIKGAVDAIRNAPPATLGWMDVTAVTDLAKGSDHLPATNGVILHLGEAGRVVIRPSGTEPKLKAYFEVRSGPVALDGVEAARRRCTLLLDDAKVALAEMLRS